MRRTLAPVGRIIVASIMLSGCASTSADDDGRTHPDAGSDVDAASDGANDTEEGARVDAAEDVGSETPDACRHGERRCEGARVVTCSDRGTWVSVEDCPYVCLAGECAGACVPGSTGCNGRIPSECSDSGQWVEEKPCEFVCVEGTCTGACLPGSRHCEGGAAQTCSDDGQWEEEQPCTFVCLDGVCAGVCSPGSRRCSDLVPEVCSESGEWEVLPPCAVECHDGACLPDGPVDPGTQTSWQPTLLATPNGLAVVYEETDGVSYWNVKIARFDLEWEASTTVLGHRIIRDGADVDSAGVVHVALADEGGAGAWHARSDQGWALAPIEGIAPGFMTCAVDQDGNVHLTSAIHLHQRYYANNVGGAFQVVSVSASNTAPAAILAAPGLPVSIAYNHWSSRQIRIMDGDNWAEQSVLHQYGIDNGPGLALKHRDGNLRVAFAYHQNTYATSNVGFQTNASGTWLEETLASQVPTTNSIDLSIDPAGHNHVVTCDVAGQLSYYTDRTGVWAPHVIPGIECRPSPIDSQFWNGRIHVAYQGTDLRLHVASIDPAAFGGGR